MGDIRDLFPPTRRARRLRGLDEMPRMHWRVASDPVWLHRPRTRGLDTIQTLLLAVGGGAVLGLLAATGALPLAMPSAAMANAGTEFGFCHTGGGTNCVVDGDTFWMDGVKIRIADIDTPETHPPRCAEEAALGARATERLRDLLNAGPLELTSVGRDVDRYGRKLRVVSRAGQSIGDMLVAEGLAREWDGARRPWCTT